MLYYLLRAIVRFALLFFCRKIVFNTKKYCNTKGPLLLAVNHPNSFLDAIIIGVFFKQPVHFLARGDVFKKSIALKLLTALHCIPVYRLREGKEYLHLNDTTFEKCRAIFAKGGIVLIFSEGLCLNEYNLRPLKKGTARLALSSWQQANIGHKLSILPIGITYSSFTNGLKKVWVNYGNLITATDIDTTQTEGNIHAQINVLLTQQLQQLCITNVPYTADAINKFSFVLNNSTVTTAAQFNTFNNHTTAIIHSIREQPIAAIHHSATSSKMYYQSILLAVLLFPISLPALLLYYPIYVAVKHKIKRSKLPSEHYDSLILVANTLVFVAIQPLILIMLLISIKSWTLALALPILLIVSTYFLTKWLLHWHRFWNYHKLTNEQRVTLQRY